MKSDVLYGFRAIYGCLNLYWFESLFSNSHSMMLNNLFYNEESSIFLIINVIILHFSKLFLICLCFLFDLIIIFTSFNIICHMAVSRRNNMNKIYFRLFETILPSWVYFVLKLKISMTYFDANLFCPVL